MSVTLDCSDLDSWMGKPISSAQPTEPLANNDFRRWAQAMHYPNRLHFDAAYAAESRWGRLTAPQSFAIACDDGQGCVPSCVGYIPNSHQLFGGDEWWWYGPRMFAGDRIVNERIPFDYMIKETSFAGPTCFQRGDNNYYNDRGELIAKQRSTSIRYDAEAGRRMAARSKTSDFETPEWTDEQLVELEGRKLHWVQALAELGRAPRYWDDVLVGAALPERLIGPHTVASFATEWRAFLMNVWNGMLPAERPDTEALGFVMSGHGLGPDQVALNPELGDGSYWGPARGHLSARWAREIGMPRIYGYGAAIGAWMTDYLAGWAGEWGMVVHSDARYQSPALVGDLTVMNGEVVDRFVDDQGRHLVQVKCLLTNQTGSRIASTLAEIELPRRRAGQAAFPAQASGATAG